MVVELLKLTKHSIGIYFHYHGKQIACKRCGATLSAGANVVPKTINGKKVYYEEKCWKGMLV